MGLDSQQNSTDTKKDEKLGYCLFKEGHVSNVQAKPNIPNSVSGKSFILKDTVQYCINEEAELYCLCTLGSSKW